MGGTLYEGTDGYYYGCTQVWERLESGRWTPFCWDTESGQEWVETETGDLLCLTPVTESALPTDVSVEYTENGAIVRGNSAATAAEQSRIDCNRV